MPTDNTQIDRKETVTRILLTLLFVVIVEGVIKTMLAAVILFELAYALLTRRAPGERVRRFANRTLSYCYRIMRFLTYNEPEPPFPFADFPSEVEPPAPLHQRTAGETDRA
jgi:Domain of unknown function (DUF4389)